MSATPRRAAIYCRISSDPTGRAAGVQRQETECRELAARRGWQVVDVLVDNDTSAVARDRPGWARLLDGARTGRYDAVVAWHPDRFLRSLRGLADLLDAVQAGRAEVATVNAGDLDLSTAAGRLQASILGVVAAHEREHTGERVKAAHRQRREHGLPMGRVSWGWQPDRLTADRALTATLRHVADGVVAGRSLRELADELAAAGVAPPAGGDGWDADSVRAVLRRPANTGRYRDGRRGAWEPLLTDEQAARVAAVLSDPARRSTAMTTRARLLGGVARCAEHGDPMYARHQKRTGRDVYVPRGRQCCSAPVLDTDHLVEAVVLGYLEREDVRAEHAGPDGGALAELDAARRAADELDAELTAGRIDGTRWARLNAVVGQQVAHAEAAVTAQHTGTPLAGVTGPAAREAWAVLPVGRRSAIVAALLAVTVHPGRRGVRVFDPERVELTWITGV